MFSFPTFSFPSLHFYFFSLSSLHSENLMVCLFRSLFSLSLNVFKLFISFTYFPISKTIYLSSLNSHQNFPPHQPGILQHAPYSSLSFSICSCNCFFHIHIPSISASTHSPSTSPSSIHLHFTFLLPSSFTSPCLHIYGGRRGYMICSLA